MARQLDTVRDTYGTYLTAVTAQMPVLAPIDPSSPAAAVALTRERERGNAMGDTLATTRNDLAARVVAARTATEPTIDRGHGPADM